MALTFALLLDALLGEPRWLWDRLPHPAVLMGRLIGAADSRFNRGPHRRLAGALMIGALSLAAFVVGWVLASLPGGPVIETVLAAILLAHRSLVDHVRDVAAAMGISTAAARASVARIVGRDTAELDDPAIARAAIESAAENFSDGVIAPAFWFLLLGLPGILVYKLVNTADSMIGYRTERHRDFGWAAARLDDLMNWLPARLSAVLLLAAGGVMNPAGLRRDAKLHRSPNAGWPEAAMARALGVALAGPRSYEGQMREFPFVHPAGRRDIGAAEIRRAVTVLWRSWAATLALVAILAVV